MPKFSTRIHKSLVAGFADLSKSEWIRISRHGAFLIFVGLERPPHRFGKSKSMCR